MVLLKTVLFSFIIICKAIQEYLTLLAFADIGFFFTNGRQQNDCDSLKSKMMVSLFFSSKIFVIKFCTFFDTMLLHT